MTLSVLEQRDQLGVQPGQLYIDGTWCDAADGGVWEQRNPASNEVVTSFAVGNVADVDRAVAAARRAFDEGPWPRLTAKERKTYFTRLVALIAEHGEELNRLQTLEMGMPIAFSSMSVVSSEMAAGIFDHHAGWIDKICGSTYPTYEAGPTGADVQIMSFREPVGVVAAIIPWNAPMMLFAQKVAPALATGCTVVVKPSEFAVLTSLKLTALIAEAGFPPGVVNLVPGPGHPTGEALITHPGVDKVTFTGSRAVGKRILEASGDTVKRVTLELGGKSPSIIFEDAESVEGAAMMAMGMVSMGLSGQG
jgi:aldehyde dehydrogenase (NAD+)